MHYIINDNRIWFVLFQEILVANNIIYFILKGDFLQRL